LPYIAIYGSAYKLPIGTQCMNCHKFDKVKAHRANISSLKTKYGVTKEACDCIV
jgi:nitrate/TMAO reductase-like tetraheme cytochrome c subunit